MSFLNIPLKSIQGNVTEVLGTETMPWYNPLNFPPAPGQTPAASQQFYRWKVSMSIDTQLQSSYVTRSPGSFNGYDVTVGQWITNTTTGQAWQIISIESKTNNSVVMVVQDIYRYNTFRDVTQTGNGSPGVGVYIIFNLSDDGNPQIDPIPSAGVSASFTQNLMSRFSYINLQYDYPLYQAGNTFAVNDVIAVDSTTHSFILAGAENKIVIGRVTSISDIIPGWFTINPVNKVVDFLDDLPGDTGDIIYASSTEAGKLTVETGGPPVYIKLRNSTNSTVVGTATGPTTPNNVLSVNNINVTIAGTGSSQDLVDAINTEFANTGVAGELALAENSVETNPANITTTYGEPALYAASSPASASINGVTVTFTSRSTDPGYEDYARPAQMAKDINDANIINITATTTNSGTRLKIINSNGGAITIVNLNNDSAGVPFAGANSASGIPLSTPATTNSVVKFTAIDSRAINFLDVVGTTTIDFGLTSVENGTKAAGLYIEGGLRSSSSNNPASITVVTDLTALNALTPLIGDQAYVIDSNDGLGNNVGNWSMWLYDGSQWKVTATEDSTTSIGKSISAQVNFDSPSSVNIGSIPSGSRITLITVQVTAVFDTVAELNIGYTVNVPNSPINVPDGLMTNDMLDLSIVGAYTSTSTLLFGSDTADGDVTVTAQFVSNSATVGSAKIIVSYV